MTTYNRSGQHDDGLQVWQPPQQGLEFDPRSTNAKRSDYRDKNPVPFEHRSYEGFGMKGSDEKKVSRNPFGLSPLLFGLLVALLTSIVLGGALGGGLGSAIKSSNDRSTSTAATITVTKTASASSAPSATSSATYYTDYIAPLPAQVLSVPYDCPDLNTRTITTAQDEVFSFVCGVDYSGNDIAALTAYSIEACCGACSAMNFQQGATVCGAFTFNANMSYAYAEETPRGGNNCWLKSKTDAGTLSSGNGLLIVGGRLN